MPAIDASLDVALDAAVTLHQSGRLDEAKAAYRRILEAAPHAHPVLYALGIACAQGGQLAEAETWLDQAVARQPLSPDYHTNLGKIRQALGRPGEAAACHRRAIALQPDAPGVLDLLGACLQNLDLLDPAIAAFGRALALSSADAGARQRLALLLHLRGVRHLDEGRPHPAVEDLSRACRMDPDSADILFDRANALAKAGRTGDAMACYRMAIARQPDHPNASFNLGFLQRVEQAYPAAAASLGAAVRLCPDRLDARENLAIALYASDRIAEAVAQGEAILALKARLARAAAADHPPVLLPDAPRDPARRTRNIVAFSLWGDRELYLRGAVENARAMAAVYPGWTCRVYHDDSVPPPVLAALASLGAECVMMEPGSGPATGLYWRFLASDDPAVARFVCRDCDSRIGPREKAAVDAWIASGLPFHVMRDHVLHTELMLAGLWGGMAGILPDMAALVREAASSDADRWQDQRFLRDRIWPLIGDRCHVTDSVYRTRGVPFPPEAAGTEPYSVGRRVE